jgi:hypothetical protein
MQYLPSYLHVTLISLSQDCPSQNRTVHPVPIVRFSPSSPCRRLLPAAPAVFLSLGDGSLPSPLQLSILLSFFRRITTLALSVSVRTWMSAFFQLRKKGKEDWGRKAFCFCVFFFGGVGGVTALL